MNKIEDTINNLKQEILSTPEVQEFLLNKRLLEGSKELKTLREKIAKYPQNADFLEEYNKNPLVVNYNESRKNVLEILRVIKNILSD